jgi:type IV pilus assembly protein PilY1
MNIPWMDPNRGAALLGSIFLASIGGWSGAAYAKVTKLDSTPPGLTTGVAPNMAVTFDDSGSMGFNFMGDVRPFDNGGWEHSKPWFCAGVIDPRETNPATGRLLIMNGVYYNPRLTYTPPSYADGTSFPNADATLRNVPVDGFAIYRPASANPVAPGPPSPRGNIAGSATARDGRMANLTGTSINTRYTCSGEASSPFNGAYTDPNGARPAGGPYYYRMKLGISILRSDGTVDTRAVYNAANWEAVAVAPSDYQNFANWYAYYRARHLMARTSTSLAFAKIGDTIRIAWQNMASTGGVATRFSTSTAFRQIGDVTGPVRASFYDWLFQVVEANSTPARAAIVRAGELFRGRLSLDAYDPYWNGETGKAAKDLACRKNFHMLITDGYWNGGNPLLPSGMSSTDETSVGRTLPDGRTYAPQTANTWIYSNVRGSYPTSVANIAFFYWRTDLQPSLINNVKPYWADISASATVDPANPGATPQVYWNPKNDPATWQHLSQFFVTLGLAGTLRFPDDYAALLSGTKKWPQPVSNSLPAVDDTWHGGISSRGGFFNAGNPQVLVDSLVNIITSVVGTSSSVVSPTTNTGVLGDKSISYVPNFNSSDWSGTLTAYQTTTTGALGPVLWEASGLLDARGTDRLISTSPQQRKGGAVEFTLANLRANMTEEQLARLNSSDGSGSPASRDKLASNRVDWVRGSRADEGTLLRTRSSIFGAIINAQPVYVAYPSSGYHDFFPPAKDGTAAPETRAYISDASKAYSRYVADNLARDATLYVAANDGMLHAFDARLASQPGASPGRERWAYIPSSVYDNLWKLSQKDNFRYGPTVDAAPIYRDVFFGDRWHTILVGGVRLGGRGIYALDITRPSATTVSEVNEKFLWEFGDKSTDNNTPLGNTAPTPGKPTGLNLGYTYGQPNIGRLNNGKWVVVVPAGYFPDPSSAQAAGNTYSSLFVLDPATGQVLKELRTPTTYNGVTINSYGLTTPVLGDYDNDQVDDVAFAGDLVGNVWRFDLSNLNSVPTLLYKPDAEEAQPITIMPRLFPDPGSSNFIVLFGTGRFLAASDNNLVNAVTQSVYGIRDPGVVARTPAAVTGGDLIRQSLVLDAASEVIGLTSRPVPASSKGWFFDLSLAVGERVVVTPVALFNSNRAVISTLLPRTSELCEPGTAGSVLVVDAATGGPGGGVNAGNNTNLPPGYGAAGVLVGNPPSGGALPAVTVIGGGQILIPGVLVNKGGGTLSLDTPIWRRRSWRTLND